MSVRHFVYRADHMLNLIINETSTSVGYYIPLKLSFSGYKDKPIDVDDI